MSHPDRVKLTNEVTHRLRHHPGERQFGRIMRVSCLVCGEPLTTRPCHGTEPVGHATAGDIAAIGAWLDRCEPGSSLNELVWAVIAVIAEGELPVVRVALIVALAARRVREAA